MLSSACSDLGGLVMSNIENVGPIDPTEKTPPIQNEQGTFIYLGTVAGTPEADVCLYANKSEPLKNFIAYCTPLGRATLDLQGQRRSTHRPELLCKLEEVFDLIPALTFQR
jgi:hypothetical protein